MDVLTVRCGRISQDGLLQRYLGRHGVTPNLIEHDADDVLTNETLHPEALERSAELMVMGIYGHARLRGLVLGGASREMLDDPTSHSVVVH